MKKIHRIRKGQNIILIERRDNTIAEWYMQSLKIIKTAAAVYPKKILYDIKESEKEIIKQFDELERITERLPERIKPFINK